MLIDTWVRGRLSREPHACGHVGKFAENEPHHASLPAAHRTLAPKRTLADQENPGGPENPGSASQVRCPSAKFAAVGEVSAPEAKF